MQEEKSLEREKTFTASAKKKSKKKRKGEATEESFFLYFEFGRLSRHVILSLISATQNRP